MSANTSMWLLFGKVTGQAEIGYAHVTVFIQEDISGFKIPVNNRPRVHMLKAKYDLGSIEFHLVIAEDAVLGEVVMQVAAVHEVKNKTELIGRVERVGHANNKG